MFRHVFNTVAAALAALYIAMLMELPMPPIAMVCVFIVMQPSTGQVLTKSFYRLLGTVAGALAACALAGLSASTAVFLAALGAWAALLTAAAAISKQPRAYSIVLAGYTPILIGVPALSHEGHIPPDALARLAEVAIGILCAAAAVLLNGPPRASAAPTAPPLVPKPASACLAPSARKRPASAQWASVPMPGLGRA
ncbi:MAG TPA: FUSC family protein, partial [Pseudoduganella sp.]